MTQKIYTLLFAIIALCVTLTGCSMSNVNRREVGKSLENVLVNPDKIIIYKSGITKEVEKASDEYKKIFELTNGRFHDKLSTAQDIIDDPTMIDRQKDGIGVEFIYNLEQEMSIKGDGFQPFKYYKLYFQLVSEKYGSDQGSTVHTLNYGDKEHYKDCSRGPLKYSKELIKLVSKY